MNYVKSAFMSLDKNDFLKSLCMFVLAAVFTYLAQAMQMPGFSFTGTDWGQVWQIALMSMITYLGKNLISTPDGKVAGFIGGSSTSS